MVGLLPPIHIMFVRTQDGPDVLPVQNHCPQLLSFWTCAQLKASRSVSMLLLWKHRIQLPYSQEKAQKLHCQHKYLFELVSLPSYRNHWWGGVSKQCLSISADCFSDGWRQFPKCMSTPAFSYDHKKNNITQEGDKFCAVWLINGGASKKIFLSD